MNSLKRLLSLALVILISASCAQGGEIGDRFRSRFEGGQSGVAGGGLMMRLLQRRGQSGSGGGLFGGQSLNSGITLLEDQAYGPAKLEKFDVYYKPGGRNLPVIFMVHGGAWAIGDKANSPVAVGKANHWVPNGFVFVSVNYPMLPDADPYQQAIYVAQALAYVQSHVSQWGGDPDNFILMGHSAGGHIVTLLSSNPQLATAQGARLWRGTVSLDSAVLNVSDLMNSRHYGLYDRAFGTDQDLWHRASPSDQLTTNARPMLLICSTHRDDSCQQAQGFSARASSMGVRTSVLPEDMSHGEINSNAGVVPAYTADIDRFIQSILR